MKLYQIKAPHFVAGFTVRDDRVRLAARIISYMRGWKIHAVGEYCNKKGWQLSPIFENWRDRKGSDSGVGIMGGPTNGGIR